MGLNVQQLEQHVPGTVRTSRSSDVPRTHGGQVVLHKEGRAPRSSAGFEHIRVLPQPQLPQPGPPPVLVAWLWHETTVVAVAVGALQPSQNARLSIPSHASTRHTWEHPPAPGPLPGLGRDQELLMGRETIASSHVPHQWL